MATLIEDTNMLVESICWHCTEAYADKCKFHDRTSGYAWEEKLKIPSKVATREVIVTQKTDSEPAKGYTSYKVLECPSYRQSERKRKELKNMNKQESWAVKAPVPAQAPAPAPELVPSKPKISNHVPPKSSKPVPTIKIGPANTCVICGAPAKKLYCSKLCQAMGAGLGLRRING